MAGLFSRGGKGLLTSLATEVFGPDVDAHQLGGSLKDFEWRYRIIVVSGREQEPLVDLQLAGLLTQQPDLAERDLIVMHVKQTQVAVLFGPDDKLDADNLRSDLDLATDEFSIVLVGKDGGVKLRASQPVAPETLFGLIDQMPMRKRETNG